jgi:hypothetical protein
MIATLTGRREKIVPRKPGDKTTPARPHPEETTDAAERQPERNRDQDEEQLRGTQHRRTP